MRALQNLDAVKLDLKTTKDLAEKMGVKLPDSSTQMERLELTPPPKKLKVLR